MSDAALAHVAREHREEPFSDKALQVALALARRADPTTHQVQVSSATLSAEAGVSRRYLWTLRLELLGRQLITYRCHRAGKSDQAATYTFPALQAAAGTPKEPILLTQRRQARQQRADSAKMRARTEDRMQRTRQQMAHTTQRVLDDLQHRTTLPAETLQQIFLFLREHLGA